MMYMVSMGKVNGLGLNLSLEEFSYTDCIECLYKVTVFGEDMKPLLKSVYRPKIWGQTNNGFGKITL